MLPAIGRAMREKGCRVLFFAGYGTEAERFKAEEIEAASDTTVWCCREPPGVTPERAEDSAFTGSLVEAIAAYGRDELGAQPIPLSEVDRVVAIGPAPMMAALAEARHGLLKTMLKTSHLAIGGINSPMQCMMKEICAQCLQPQRDPATGEERLVFSCFDQNQPLDEVDFAALKERLRQNSVQEKLTRQWIERCLETLS